ncbi:MAG: lipoprotein [Planctomycetota bacterium]|nr:MAG: lipoprotein [Planctomycetota bacterium]
MPDFLNPAAIGIAAAATIPPLVALYFLKLKRRVHVVPSTFLWKRTVEDLQVNSPFQRLRKSLLLLLQLLVLTAGALALGVPMCEQVEQREQTLILLVDQSASMNVIEEGNKTRLDLAKARAKQAVADMPAGSRAMVIAFCDRAAVAASFDTDKRALSSRIDAIEATQSTTSLGEALSLAEAYSQNVIIGGTEEGKDVAPTSAAPDATVLLYTDGRITDGDRLAVERLKVEAMEVVAVGARADNVGILSMDTKRHYERPDVLQVFASLRNFGPEPVRLDASLYINDAFVDNQVVELEGFVLPEGAPDAVLTPPTPGSAKSIAFDEVNFNTAGVVEIRLRVDDALTADNRAWCVVEPPRNVRVLLVTPGNFLLEEALGCLPVQLEVMRPSAFEAAVDAGDAKVMDGERCRYDVVVMDAFSTAKLPQGNYFFWGGAPKIDGVTTGAPIRDQRFFDWDDTHPVLRHVPVAAVDAFEWLDLKVPVDATPLIKGQSSPVLAHLTRGASQYLICAFSLIVQDDAGNPMLNTFWVTKPHFIVFLQNAVQFLSSSLMSKGVLGAPPGQPVTIPVPPKAAEVAISRPDGQTDRVPSAGFNTVHYARTRATGLYRVDPALPGHEHFAVNLFDPVESHVAPRTKIAIGAETVQATTTEQPTNRPAWPYVLLAMLLVLSLEWVVYNRRVFV